VFVYRPHGVPDLSRGSGGTRDVPAWSAATDSWLLEVEPVGHARSLDQATQVLADVRGADKVGAFVCEPATSTRVARRTSNMPMVRKQHASGGDRLPMAHGGRVSERPS